VTASWLVTFLAVVVAWVFFRADTLSSALRILAGMLHLTPEGANVFHQNAAATLRAWTWCAALLFAALVMPNTQEIMRDHLPTLSRPSNRGRLLGRTLGFGSTAGWAVAIGVMLCLGLACMPQPTNFLYFNF